LHPTSKAPFRAAVAFTPRQLLILYTSNRFLLIVGKLAGNSLPKLIAYADCPNLLVLALPRGGVPIAYEVARALYAPLDVFLVRKLGQGRRNWRWAPSLPEACVS
jgi:hypothetical protein